MEERSVMAKSVEEQGLRMVHLEREGRQLEREVNILIMETLTMVMLAMRLVILRMMVHLEREGRQLERGELMIFGILAMLIMERRQLFILRGENVDYRKKDFVKARDDVQTLPKALRTQALITLTSNFGLVGSVR